MKTIAKIRMVVLVLFSCLILSCGTRHTGSAADTTGTNGATNGTGKIPESDGTHSQR